MTICALILAAGRGVRAGGGLPKQYRLLAGEPLLRHSLRTFAQHPEIDAVCAVIHPDDEALYLQSAEGLDLLPVAYGGATRQASGINGLQAIAHLSPKFVLIHDGARGLIDANSISRVIAALDTHDGAIAAVPVSDTIKRSGPGAAVAETLDRSVLWRAQTPQGFDYSKILAAHRSASSAEATDDAAVAEAAGMDVILVEGNEANIKITLPDDFARAESILATRRAASHDAPLEPRIGSGFDVHRFGPGDGVRLCGIDIAHDQSLLGHSDADVGLHAITDAILGAVGAGDIGSHFPPSDPQWRGADSAIFLAAAVAEVRRRGGRVASLDVTLICERPKIGPHRPEMRKRIAEICDLPVERISVKATTTEQLGFTGRREGIAAQSVALILLPA